MGLLDEVTERLSIFKNLYDAIRVVDPINKKILTVDHDGIKQMKDACYGFWNKNEFCENCTSMRAYINDDTCVKMECKDKSVLLIISAPIVFEGETYIIEMLKDITKTTNDYQSVGNRMDGVNFLLKEIGNKILRDDLTGIYNRRYISERLPVDINRSALNKTPLSIIMVDIDFFKIVNDTYGHVAGDKVLKDFALHIQESIDHDTCWAARYGGEEFIVVLDNTNIDTAYEAAEKIRKKLAEKVFIYDDMSISITSSFGVYCTEGRSIKINDLINEVDKNLYRAKQSGRNMTIK